VKDSDATARAAHRQPGYCAQVAELEKRRRGLDDAGDDCQRHEDVESDDHGRGGGRPAAPDVPCDMRESTTDGGSDDRR
jgi:hypothetical protein